jgi:Na+/H+ antiporter NhaD/arsenite permease-like protein
MIPALIIFFITFFFIVTEKLDRTAAAVLGASLLVFTGLIPHHAALEHIDLDVIFLLIGMMTVVNILSETGLFEWVAVFIAQRARGNGVLILIGLLVATAVLSALLDNVTTVVLIAPITILITQILEIPAVPFLILEAIFSNIGGTATLVGDPPNILIGSRGDLTFNQFLAHLSPVVAVIMIIALVVVVLLFRKRMRVRPDAKDRIMKARPNRAITDPWRLKRGLAVFGAILTGFCICHHAHIEPGLVALAGAFTMLVVCRSNLRRAMEKIEWETIFFLIGLFMLVGALEYNGLFEMLGSAMFEFTGDRLYLTTLAVLWMSALLSAAFGNIPVVIALIPLVKTLIPGFAAGMGADMTQELTHLRIEQPLWWALALGACLGGNGTLFGAAANVVVSQIAKKNQYSLSFFTFTRYGFPIMVISLMICSVYLYTRYFLLAG